MICRTNSIVRRFLLCIWSLKQKLLHIITVIMMLYKNTKKKWFRSSKVAGVLQRDTLASYLFIICLYYILWTSIDLIRVNGLKLTKKKKRGETMIGWLFLWVLRYINLCRLLNAKSIFMKRDLFQTIQFSISTQFECEKHFYFNLFSLVKQFYR